MRERTRLADTIDLDRIREQFHPEPKLECELLNGQRFPTQAEAKMAVFDFIEGFYDPRRRPSALGRISPINFERRLEQAAVAA